MQRMLDHLLSQRSLRLIHFLVSFLSITLSSSSLFILCHIHSHLQFVLYFSYCIFQFYDFHLFVSFYILYFFAKTFWFFSVVSRVRVIVWRHILWWLVWSLCQVISWISNPFVSESSSFKLWFSCFLVRWLIFNCIPVSWRLCWGRPWSYFNLPFWCAATLIGFSTQVLASVCMLWFPWQFGFHLEGLVHWVPLGLPLVPVVSPTGQKPLPAHTCQWVSCSPPHCRFCQASWCL